MVTIEWDDKLKKFKASDSARPGCYALGDAETQTVVNLNLARAKWDKIHTRERPGSSDLDSDKQRLENGIAIAEKHKQLVLTLLKEMPGITVQQALEAYVIWLGARIGFGIDELLVKRR